MSFACLPWASSVQNLWKLHSMQMTSNYAVHFFRDCSVRSRRREEQ